MSRTIALTGATGFIGSNLTRRLVDTGLQIRALVRPTSKRFRPAGSAISWIEGHLEDPESLRRLIHRADAIVHCAGAVRGVSERQFDHVNVDGVARLVQAAKEQHPLPRFLLISSVAAREPHLSPYAASKRKGEEALAAFAGEMIWTAFRPSAVYGPGDRELLPLFKWIGRGIAPVLGAERARVSLLYVEDLVEAIVRWLEHGGRRGAVYELHDGKPGGYSWHDVIEECARLHARRVFYLKVPKALLQSLAWLNTLAATVIGFRPMLTPGKVRELRHPSWVCDNTRLSQDIGWVPRISLREGLRRTLQGNVTYA